MIVWLTGTDLRLVSIRPNRRFLRSAYLVSDRRFRLGGSVFTFRLSAVESIPAGSCPFLRFRA